MIAKIIGRSSVVYVLHKGVIPKKYPVAMYNEVSLFFGFCL